MNLYNKDYKIVSDSVSQELNRYSQIKTDIRSNHFDIQQSNYSNEFYRAIDLFPNNFIEPHDDWGSETLSQIYEELKQLIQNTDSTERGLLNFINHNKHYCIITSLFHYYTFGHHGMYLFNEFPLSGTYFADYLIIGRSSFGLSLVFIELENIYDNITLGSGHFGETIRKGLNQVTDWKSWLDSNYTNLREKFLRQKGDHKDLPQELTDYDSTRIHFMVVAGRRRDYNQTTYRLRREIEPQRIRIIHYDNLLDSMMRLFTTAPFNFEP